MGDFERFSDRLPALSESDCSTEIQHALHELDCEGLGPIRLCRWNQSHVAFAFTVCVDIPTGGTVDKVDVRPIEPILIVLNSSDYPSLPPQAYADRVDFPAEQLPHINVTEQAVPAHLCLHRGNMADWFAEHSISDFVSRLRSWLRDAASGRLIREDDGFEPTRIANSIGICVFDDERFTAFVRERWTTAQSASGSIFVASDLLKDFSSDFTKDAGFAVAANTPLSNIPTELVKKASRLHFLMVEGAPTMDRPIFAILLWAPQPAVTRYFGRVPKTFGEFAEFAHTLNLPAEQAIQSYRNQDLHIIGGIPIIIAIPRPKKVLGTESTLEFLSFVIIASSDHILEDKKIAPSAPVFALSHRRPLTGRFARKLSAVPEVPSPRMLLVGCGAEGSKIGLHLGRAGFTDIEFVDYADISPHNLVRHGLLTSSLGKNKAEALLEELTRLYHADGRKAFSSRKTSALRVFRDRPSLEAFNIVIDATASAHVFDLLVRSDLPGHLRVIRSELADNGRLGVMLTEGRGRTPRIDDLQTELFDLAIEDDGLAAWLNRHRAESALQRGPALEEIGIGISCGSETMRLADDVISCHSSIFSIAIRDAIFKPHAEGTIHVSTVGSAPFRVACSSVAVKSPVIMGVKRCDWVVRLSWKAYSDLKAAHRAAGRNETGGLLIGLVHRKRKLIYVTRSLPPSSDSEGSPYAFKRGVKDYPDMLDRIHNRTGNMLGYVGEWHTHPRGAPAASTTDLAALSAISATLSRAGLPAHILIVSPQGVCSYLLDSGTE